jgi:hypothetical protein
VISKQRVFLTVDVEGDWSLFPNEQKVFDSELILENVMRLDSLIEAAKRKFNINIPVTWFIRCDESVKVNLGAYDGLLKKLTSFIKKRTNIGDDFGLHPHLYSFTKSKHDNHLTSDEIIYQINEAVNAWKFFFGASPKFSRIGEARMCNVIARELERHNILIDSTALPGRSRSDNGFQFNWENTSEFLYKPSADDYRITSAKDTENLNFYEAPFSMISTQSEADVRPINRYLNLSYKSKILEPSFSSLRDKRDIICVVHPHEVTSKKGTIHPVISYNEKDFLLNIKNLINALDRPDFCSFSSINT